MELLKAVNLMLPKLGEHPVTSLTIRHPTLAIILPEVENEITTCLLKGWWFNTYEYTAYPDSEGRIAMGVDTLAFVPDEFPCVMRGRQLFNTKTADYKWDKPVKGVIKQTLPFNDLPESAAQYVWYSALCNVYVTDLGMTQDVQVWKAKAEEANTQLAAEHLRNKKYNTKQSPRFQRLRRAMRA